MIAWNAEMFLADDRVNMASGYVVSDWYRLLVAE